MRRTPAKTDQSMRKRVVVSHTNITNRKQAEEALRRSQSMLARTESIAHVGSWNGMWQLTP